MSLPFDKTNTIRMTDHLTEHRLLKIFRRNRGEMCWSRPIRNLRPNGSACPPTGSFLLHRDVLLQRGRLAIQTNLHPLGGGVVWLSGTVDRRKG